jgi:uncharacterized protein YjbJ (UPF0337 family)
MRSIICGVVLVAGLAACGNLTQDGKKDETKGKIQQAAGDVTGDSSLQAKGDANKAKGKTEKAVGKVKDAVTNP